MSEYTIFITKPDEEEIIEDDNEDEGVEEEQNRSLRVELNSITNECILYIFNKSTGKECKLILPADKLPESVTFDDSNNQCSINIPINGTIHSLKVKENEEGYILS